MSDLTPNTYNDQSGLEFLLILRMLIMSFLSDKDTFREERKLFTLQTTVQSIETCWIVPALVTLIT